MPRRLRAAAVLWTRSAGYLGAKGYRGAIAMAMQPQTANAPQAEVAHHHHTEDDAATERRLMLAVVLTTAVLLAEGIGGLLANSLALLADAGHVLTDIFALGMSWFALRQARRPADSRRTFGYHRV